MTQRPAVLPKDGRGTDDHTYALQCGPTFRALVVFDYNIDAAPPSVGQSGVS
jgi:hypothetical protein